MHHSLELLAFSTTHPPYHCRKTRPGIPCPHRSQLDFNLPFASFPSSTRQQSPLRRTTPARQAYHSWKLKYGNIQKSLKEDLDLKASSILPTLQDILDNTKYLSSQARADMACKLVGSVLHESASNVLSSPNYQPQHTHSRQPPPCHHHIPSWT